MRLKLKRSTVALVVLIGIIVGGVSAEVLQQDECYVAPDQVIDGNLYVLCRTLVIDGQVEGNVIGAAYTATINGLVKENIYLLGAQMEMNGTLGSDLHYAGVTLNVKPTAQILTGGIINLGLSGIIQTERVIPGGVLGVGYQLIINSRIRENVDFWGSSLHINGRVDGNVDASVGDSKSQEVAGQLETLLIPLQFDINLEHPGLIVDEAAQIDGLLTYRAANIGELRGTLAQAPKYIPTVTNTTIIDLVEEQNAGTAVRLYLDQVIREVTTLGLIGLLGLLIIPELVQRPIRTLRRQPLTSLGVGLITFILSFPIVLIILFLSLLVILILGLLRLDGVIVAGGILLGIVNIGGTSLFYFIAIFVSRMILSIALGRLLIRWFMPINTASSWFASLAIGVVLLALAASLPVVGWMFNAMALFFGLGSILTVLQAEFRSLRDESLEAAPIYYPATDTVTITVPPMLEERVSAPGMENLPDGFDFDFWKDQ